MTTLQDMYAAVDAAAQDHFDWCTDHSYEDPEPRTQLCRSGFALDFTAADDRDDVSRISVELAGSPMDLESGIPVPLLSIGYNGEFGDWDMAAWKALPAAYLLLAGHARAMGDEARAQAFADAANTAIVEHLAEAEAEDAAPEYVVAEPARHWSQGPFSYVQGGDLDGPLIPWDVYQAAQEAETSNALPAPDTSIGEYDIDDEVKALTGAFAGQAGVVDELDLDDPERPFRVRFEDLDGEPVAWFHAGQLEHIGAAA